MRLRIRLSHQRHHCVSERFQKLWGKLGLLFGRPQLIVSTCPWGVAVATKNYRDRDIAINPYSAT